MISLFLQYEITIEEEKLKQMKPNMAAIAEYRKKVNNIALFMMVIILLLVSPHSSPSMICYS